MMFLEGTNGNCERCEGRKFILREGKWIRCSCLKKSKRVEFYELARIPLAFHNFSWLKAKSQFSDQIEAIDRAKYVADRIEERKRARSILLKGDNTEVYAIGLLILKQAIDSDRSAYVVTSSELIEAEFDKESKPVIEPAYHCEVLFLRLAIEPRHTSRSKEYAAHAIEKLCLFRRTNKLFTFFSSKLSSTALESEYGKDLSSLLHGSPILVRM